MVETQPSQRQQYFVGQALLSKNQALVSKGFCRNEVENMFVKSPLLLSAVPLWPLLPRIYRI